MKIKIVQPLIFSIATATLAIAAEPAPEGADPKATTPPAPAKAAEDEVVATVDGDPIKRSEVNAAISQMMAQRGMPPNAIPAAQREMLVRNMIDDLVADKLVTKASSEIKVADADVDSEFAKIRKTFPGTDEDFAKQVTQAGLTLEKLKGDIRERTKKRTWLDGKIEGKFPIPSDKDAKDFYDKNPQHFEQPELVRASHILFLADKQATPAQITAAMKKAEGAIVRAKTEDFSKLAGELSEDPGSKTQGGDLNFFPRDGKMVEEFAAAAYKLKKGEVSSEPVRSQFGYHVIKVTDHKPAEKQPFDGVKPKIVDFLGREKKAAAINVVIDDLKKNAKVNVLIAPPQPPEKVATPPVSLPGEKPATETKPVRKPVEAVTPPVSAPVKPDKKKNAPVKQDNKKN